MKSELLLIGKIVAKVVIGLVLTWLVLKEGTDINSLLEK